MTATAWKPIDADTPRDRHILINHSSFGDELGRAAINRGHVRGGGFWVYKIPNGPTRAVIFNPTHWAEIPE